jgi:chromosome partitioning protein
MVLVCPHCKKKHTIDEKKIPAHIKRAKCKYCGNSFSLAAAGVRANGPRKIGVCLSKGGVGKTTTSVNLAAGLALAGYKVLLVDTDTQGQDSFVLGVKPKGGLAELINGDLSYDETIVGARKNLWLLAGSKSIAGLKRMIDRKDFGGELTLSETLARVENRYDYVIVDTSPGWDPITVNVLFYITEVLTPVSMEVMSLQGLVEFLKALASIQKYRKELSLKYIVPTFQDKKARKTLGIMEKLELMYGPILCPPIRYNEMISEAPAHGQTIYEFAPGCTGAHDYRELVRRVADNSSLFT